MGRFEPIEAGLESPVGGLDEAGRGALAGPVSVGLVVFPPAFFASAPDSDEARFLAALDDSKKLSQAARERLLPEVYRFATFASCVMMSSKAVDRMGINPATEQAMIVLVRRAAKALGTGRAEWSADQGGLTLLVDGNYRFHRLPAEPAVRAVRTEIKGDSRIASIAAASILAKVLRDRRMDRFDRIFPGYGFAVHKGYGTELHRRSMARLGLTPAHRKSYGSQLSLFDDSP